MHICMCIYIYICIHLCTCITIIMIMIIIIIRPRAPPPRRGWRRTSQRSALASSCRMPAPELLLKRR